LGDDLENGRRSGDELRNQSRHNLKYWTQQPYLGFGVDAHSMLYKAAAERRAPSPVHLEPRQAIRFATPDSLDAYMNRSPHTVTGVSEQAAIEERFFLGLRLNRGVDVEHLLAGGEVWDQYREEHDFSATNAREKTALAAEAKPRASFWESAIRDCVQDGLLEQRGTMLRLTARGRLLSNEVFARFLMDETKVGTGHVNPR
jgi:oxygen-independent coproporphyrinogen-3 oxidase